MGLEPTEDIWLIHDWKTRIAHVFVLIEVVAIVFFMFVTQDLIWLSLFVSIAILAMLVSFYQTTWRIWVACRYGVYTWDLELMLRVSLWLTYRLRWVPVLWKDRREHVQALSSADRLAEFFTHLRYPAGARLEIAREHVQALSSADRLAEFFTHLRYPAGARLEMTPQSLQLDATLTNAVRRIERLTSVEGGALQVYLFELTSQVYLFELTSVTVAHTRALTRVFRNRVGNFLLVLTDDYERLDFVLLEREIPGLDGTNVSTRSVLVRPRILSVDRRNPDRVALRVLRRFTFTEYDASAAADAYAQFDKIGSAYTVAEWSEPLFNNRALFSDYYLNERLPDLSEWNAEERNRAFRQVRKIFAQARRRFSGDDAAAARTELIRPLLETLGFRIEPGDGADFLLHAGGDGEPVAFALAYPWNRYLDGKDNVRDEERAEQNPGAQVVSLLEAGVASWGIVTNGKIWRLYSARAHSRATNYYEIDLEETLASPDPGEPFRYFYLFFRAAAFAPDPTFLDRLMEESDAYARELGRRLKERVFEHIFPHFAEGFIHGLGGSEALLALPEEEREAQLEAVFHGTLTFLYRLLFLLYAESRDLLPVREVRGYYQISLRRLKEEIAEQAGPLEDQVAGRLGQVYDEGADETALYDRLLDLFAVIDRGSKAHNVPIYNGGLFTTRPDPDDTGPEARDARFLNQTRLPDRYLALGLDRLSRDIDPKRGDLGFIDYKSLGVRQLGSIYEGLLEFKVQIAENEGDGLLSSFVIRLVSDKGERCERPSVASTASSSASGRWRMWRPMSRRCCKVWPATCCTISLT